MTVLTRKGSLTVGTLLLGVAAGVFLLVAQTHAAPPADPPAQSESVVQIGFAIAPVDLNLTGKNQALVGKGSYLVNAAGGCNDCHTWRPTDEPPNYGTNYEEGGDPFLGQPEQIYQAGYLGGGRPFGPFTSRNLTPDATGTVADGFGTFRQIMRHGFDPDGITPVLQVMPWPIYRNLSENDLKAIYEYLTSIPCVEGTPGEPENDTHRCG